MDILYSFLPDTHHLVRCVEMLRASSPALRQECRLTVTCAEEKRCLRTLLYLSCLGLQRPWVIRSAIPDYDRSVDIPSLRFQEGFPPQTLAKMFVSTIATGRCFDFFCFFIKSKQSSTNNYGISWLLFFRRESLCGRVCKQQLWDVDAWCCDSGSDHCPLSSET